MIPLASATPWAMSFSEQVPTHLVLYIFWNAGNRRPQAVATTIVLLNSLAQERHRLRADCHLFEYPSGCVHSFIASRRIPLTFLQLCHDQRWRDALNTSLYFDTGRQEHLPRHCRPYILRFRRVLWLQEKVRLDSEGVETVCNYPEVTQAEYLDIEFMLHRERRLCFPMLVEFSGQP